MEFADFCEAVLGERIFPWQKIYLNKMAEVFASGTENKVVFVPQRCGRITVTALSPTLYDIWKNHKEIGFEYDSEEGKKMKQRFEQFNDDELYMLKRALIEFQKYIFMIDDAERYSEEEQKIANDLLNESIENIKYRREHKN